jgi:hypothetical protein
MIAACSSVGLFNIPRSLLAEREESKLGVAPGLSIKLPIAPIDHVWESNPEQRSRQSEFEAREIGRVLFDERIEANICKLSMPPQQLDEF